MQSRYYDPDVKRFINADGLISVDQEFLGNNLYSYFGNNPITYVDYTGNRLTVGGGGSQDSLYETLKVTDSEYHDYVKGTKKQKTPVSYSYNVEELRMDTDGAKGDYNSSSHQSGTSIQYNKDYLGLKTPADKIPFVVVPEYTESKTHNALLGCIAIVKDNESNRFVYAIVADVGSSKKGYGEVSLKAAWDLGFSKDEANGRCGPEGDFTIIIFPDTKMNWTNDNLYEQIRYEGKKIYP